MNLLTDENLRDETRLLFEEVVDQTNLANELIDEFLDIQRLEEGKLCLEIGTHDLVELLGDRPVSPVPPDSEIRCDAQLTRRMIAIHCRGAEPEEIRIRPAAVDLRIEFVGVHPPKLALRFCEAAARAQGGEIGVERGMENTESRWISFPRVESEPPN
ncbi:MAG: hypothetical protein AAF585_07255 [Verrucomicrobiota bacterium]